jgi:hypothetical protein
MVFADMVIHPIHASYAVQRLLRAENSFVPKHVAQPVVFALLSTSKG